MENTNICKHRNSLLDGIKGLACFAVVFMHVKFPGTLGGVITILSSFAVPVFFMTSGFYAVEKNKGGYRKSTYKLLRILLFAVIIYFVYALLVNIKDGTMHLFFGQFLNGGTWIRLLLINDFECIKAFHLWFLPALIYAYIILYLTIEKIKINIKPKIIGVILIARIIVLSFINTNGLSWHLSGNWLVFGVPYIFVGYAIATKLDAIKEMISIKMNIILILSSALAEIVCVFISPQVNITEIFVVCNSISIFVFAVRNDVEIRCVPLETIGNKYSLNIYVWHIFVNGVITFGAGLLGIRESNVFIWLNPLIVLISTLVLSVIIEVIKNTLFNKETSYEY